MDLLGFTFKVSDLVLGKPNPLDLAVTTGYLGLQIQKYNLMHHSTFALFIIAKNDNFEHNF